MGDFIKLGKFSVKDRVARVWAESAKSSIQELSARVDALHEKLPIIPVNELPTGNINEGAIYLLPSQDGKETNKYIEYVYLSDTNEWEELGAIVLEFDIDDYVKKDDLKSEKWEFTLDDGSTVIKKKVFAEDWVE